MRVMHMYQWQLKKYRQGAHFEEPRARRHAAAPAATAATAAAAACAADGGLQAVISVLGSSRR